MKLLIISGDTALAQGKKGPFYYMLEELSKYWERIDIICPRTQQTAFNVHSNIYIYSANKSKIFQPWFILKKGLEIYKKEKFDLFTVHSYPPFYNDIGGRWLYNRIGIPYGLEVMHITGYPKAGNFKDWFYKILTRLFIKFSAKNAIAVRVINQRQVPEFLKKSGVSEEKIKFAAASYIDLETFKPLDLARGKKYDVVFSGRLVKNKGIFLLLKAIKNLKFKIKNLKLIIIGSGPLEGKIRKYIRQYNLQDNVEFAGWLPTIKDLARIYNQSRIMVMPSFNEGGPRVTLEAMACKVPVITSRVGIMLDIIEDGENGLFIDWDAKDIAEKILLLLQDENLRKKIAENGYNTAQKFERRQAIKNYAETYQALLHSTRI
jgi:glycosyltransferase involved in cell wall biosynthesis